MKHRECWNKLIIAKDYVAICLVLIKISLIVDVLNQLKLKTIEEYTHYIHMLNKGYRKDYTHILNLISLIELGDKIDNYKFVAQ